MKRPPITYSFKVLALSENRMGAKLVPDFMENVTPPEQLEALEMSRFSAFGVRDRGAGRPTKKDRRDMESYMEVDGDFSFFDFDDDEEYENDK